jgi:virginiamycin B lyase
MIRLKILLGAFAILMTLAVTQNFTIVAKAQQAVEGVYWKDADASQNPPRTASDREALPDPYYEVDPGLRFPEERLGVGWSGVRFDSHGNIWTLDSGDPPIREFDSSGRYLKSIGQGQGWFVGPHFLYIDKEDNLWVADNQARPGKGNQVTKISPDGKVLLRLGKPGVKGESPENFMGPVGVVTNANGDIFVTDGHFVEPDGGGRAMAGEYFNWEQGSREVTHARIAKFSKDGKFIKQWGKEGSGPGEFYVPHGIAMDSQGRLFVADRGNNRLQIFDQEGKFLAEWKQFGKPVDVFVDKNDTIYVTDSDSNQGLWSWKYSSVGQAGCLECLIRVPRLTDVGTPNPGFTQGIRIGSAKDGTVRAFIPPHMGAEGPTTIPERAVADAMGNVWVSDARTSALRKYAKKPELPEGAGKRLVQKACESCHGLREFPRVNFDHEDWQTAVDTMVGGGAPLTKEEIPLVVDYLAATFKGGDANGVEVPGKVQATITEWDLPTPNSLPLDVIKTRGNGVFYTGLFANVLGRFDPKTQRFEEYHLRPGTNPSSLLEFPGANFLGSIWFTSQTEGLIGEFHPMLGYMGYWGKGDVFEHTIPGPKLLLHNIGFGQGGLWFTVPEARPPLYPAGSKIGRMNQYSLEVKMADLPTAIADPSGLAFNSKGFPFFAERGTSELGSVNPQTMQVTEYLLPEPGSGATSITITADDAVWYADNRRGYLGRFEPKTGTFREWPSPSGPRSLPDGITHVGDTIWYVESGTKPNMLVRFDPKTEKFQSWPVKAGGGIKHIFADPDGSLWFTRPLANGIAHVEIKEE